MRKILIAFLMNFPLIVFTRSVAFNDTLSRDIIEEIGASDSTTMMPDEDTTMNNDNSEISTEILEPEASTFKVLTSTTLVKKLESLTVTDNFSKTNISTKSPQMKEAS